VSEKHYSQFIGIGRETLPVLIKPLPDELLSCWIMRYSKELLTKSHTFCKFVYKTENVWNRDVDLNASDKFLAELAAKSFLSYGKVLETTLKSYYPNLFVGVGRKWIIPIGIYHRTRKNAGQMFCPGCFRNDNIPYYRKKWRLSLSVVCPDCKINLIERCPKCDSPISFHRLEVGRKESILKHDVCLCHECSFDFRKTKAKAANESLINFQSFLYSTLDRGYNDSNQYSHLYFDVVYQMNRIISSSQEKFRAFDKELSKRSGLKYSLSVAKYDFDRMPIEDRALVLSKTNWLLERWPDRLFELANDMHFFSSYLLRDFNNAPYWYWRPVMDNTHIVHAQWRSDKGHPYHHSYSAYGEAMMNKAKKTI
jgi:hypothetical protein